MSMPEILFVVGAGASYEVGLPLGAALRATIANLIDIRCERKFDRMSGDERVVEALSFHARASDGGSGNIHPYLHECRKIRDAMAQAASIDNYLDAHNENIKLVYCGKLSIVRAILEAEKASKLRFQEPWSEKQIDFKGVQDTWFSSLWQKIAENCTAENLADRLSRVAFLVFNYDRCLERYLHCAMRNYYHFDEQGAAALVGKVKIFHPYGRVGKLPWESSPEPVDFGADVHPNTLNQLANGIKTFTEGTNPEESPIEEIRALAQNATKIVFLGFAFHANNLELMFPRWQPTSKIRKAQIFGTAKGISDSDLRVITAELAEGLKVPTDQVYLKNSLECRDLFAEFGRSIAFR